MLVWGPGELWLWYMGGTHGSCVLSSAGNVLEMSVVRGVGGVCGMCLARGRWEVLELSGWATLVRVWVKTVCVCCESGFSVLMAGPGICILY